MKMAMKSQWMRIVAVAAAAACAVTATAVGTNFPMTKADAAEGATSYGTVYVCGQAGTYSFWNATDAGQTPAEITGNGSYEATYTIDGDGSGTVDCLILQSNILTDTYNDFDMNIDSITVNGTAVEYNGPADGCKWDDKGLRVNIYNVWVTPNVTDINNSGSWKGDLTIAFTVAGLPTDKETEGGEETTTSDTTTTTTIDTDDTTTTTTTVTTIDTDDTATTTTSDTDDTTTTTSTTTTVDTTTTTTTSDTTTTTTTTVTLDTKIDFTQQTGVGNDGSKFAYVEFDPAGADSVTVVYKVLSSDNNTTVSFGTWTGEEWLETKYEDIAVPSNKLVTQSSDIPSNVGETMKISVYWPSASSVQFVSVTLHYNEPPVVTTTTTTTTATTTTIAGDKVPTYTTTIGIKDKTNKEEIQIDLNDIVYVVVSAEGQVGKKISGAMYAGGDEIVWQDEIVDETGLYIIDYVNVNREAYASYQIYYNNGQDVTNVSYKAYKRYDASLNDKVNASDILAILKYIRGTEKNTVQDIVCDINEDGVVKMNDAVALVKYILGTETAE